MKVRTRFAPSPTGYLHIGGARTALFAWLFARKNKGEFILRIEDTDLDRSTKESIDGILEGINWLGLSSDKKPIFQSERIQRYNEVLDILLKNKLAYYCNCDQERLRSLREEQLAQKVKPKYDNHCRDRGLTHSEETVIRFCNPLTGVVTFEDLVFGNIGISNEELDDLVLLRTDGMPTYNFAAAIDDYDMNITHVIRGDDHINNTPKQINILQALDFSIPKFAHLPMILNESGKRMSKRHDAVNVISYRDEGFLPEAMLNYLVRLGWSYGDQEIFSVDEMINLFSLSDVNKSPAVFSKTKLLWFNKNYIQKFEKINYLDTLKTTLEKLDANISIGPSLDKILPIFAKRSETLIELAEDCLFLYLDNISYDSSLIDKFFIDGIEKSISKLVERLGELDSDEWSIDNISLIIKDIIKEDGLKFPHLGKPVRLALTGGNNSPSIDQIIFLLGKERTIDRINKLIALVSQ